MCQASEFAKTFFLFLTGKKQHFFPFFPCLIPNYALWFELLELGQDVRSSTLCKPKLRVNKVETVGTEPPWTVKCNCYAWKGLCFTWFHMASHGFTWLHINSISSDFACQAVFRVCNGSMCKYVFDGRERCKRQRLRNLKPELHLSHLVIGPWLI